jgi:hypothetical protein
VIADTTEALGCSQDRSSLYNMRGFAHYNKGEHDIAISDFRAAQRIGPQGYHLS